MQASAPLPAADVQQALADVLARVELDERESLLERLIRWLDPHLPSGSVENLGDVLLWIFVVAAVAAALVAFVRAWAIFRAPEISEEHRLARVAASTHDRLRELAAAARAARASGDLRLALRLSFHGLILALGGRGDLELRQAWTNRELLRRGKVSGAARALLEPLVRELEPKEFGRAGVNEADVDELERLLVPYLERPHLARPGGTA